jgi:DNA-binding response OmpR family regulator
MSKKILVVEDDETMRSTLAALLRCEGFEVLTARNGEDGYHQALAACPDLIITDLQMPVLSGVELAQRIRQCGQLSQGADSGLERQPARLQLVRAHERRHQSLLR